MNSLNKASFSPSRFKIGKVNECLEVAREINQHFSELPISRLTKMAKDKGPKFLRQTFIEAIKANFPNRLALFLKNWGKTKVKWYAKGK